jgi:hypothetical protein
MLPNPDVELANIRKSMLDKKLSGRSIGLGGLNVWDEVQSIFIGHWKEYFQRKRRCCFQETGLI